MSDTEDEIDTRYLDAMLEALGSQNQVRIGILGGKNVREDDGSNASIGMKHEFGDGKMPMRSFLRMPLITRMQIAIDYTGAFDKSTLAQVIKTKSLNPWLKKLGILGENVVGDAFATGGFGQWKPSDMRYKKVHQTLVETQQLRNSITSEVPS